VIGEDDEPLGVLETSEALRRARDAGLDLVEVAPNRRTNPHRPGVEGELPATRARPGSLSRMSDATPEEAQRCAAVCARFNDAAYYRLLGLTAESDRPGSGASRWPSTTGSPSSTGACTEAR